MDLALWIIAGLLGAIFLIGGIGKLVMPKEKIAATPFGGWVEDFSTTFIKTIGAIEVLAAVGLVLPAVLDVAPVLVPLAGMGLVFLMAGAAIIHLRRGEYKIITANIAYLAMAGFVMWGRFGPESFGG